MYRPSLIHISHNIVILKQEQELRQQQEEAKLDAEDVLVRAETEELAQKLAEIEAKLCGMGYEVQECILSSEVGRLLSYCYLANLPSTFPPFHLMWEAVLFLHHPLQKWC